MQAHGLRQTVNAGEGKIAVGIAWGTLHEPGEGGAERLDLLSAQAGDVLAQAVRRDTRRRRVRRSRGSDRIPVEGPVLEGLPALSTPRTSRIRRHIGVRRLGMTEHDAGVALDTVIGAEILSLPGHMVHVLGPEEEPDVRHVRGRRHYLIGDGVFGHVLFPPVTEPDLNPVPYDASTNNYRCQGIAAGIQ